MTSTPRFHAAPAGDSDHRRLRQAIIGTPLGLSVGLSESPVRRDDAGRPIIVVWLTWESRLVEVEVTLAEPGSDRALRMRVGHAELRYALWDAVIERAALGTGLNPHLVADSDAVHDTLADLLRALA